MKANKVLSFRQRLALQVGKAAHNGIMLDGTSFPYGFRAYARCAARCAGKKLVAGYAYDTFTGEFGA